MRKRQGTDYWRDQIEAWRQSGQSQIAYCVRHDVNIKSFRRWRIKLLQGTASTPALTLVPVSVTTPLPEPIIRLHSPAGWRIELPLIQTDLHP